jgi:hypothetical protein
MLFLLHLLISFLILCALPFVFPFNFISPTPQKRPIWAIYTIQKPNDGLKNFDQLKTTIVLS